MDADASTSAPRSGACEKDEEQLEREEFIIKPPPENGVIGRREQYSSPADRILDLHFAKANSPEMDGGLLHCA
jgi:hypothetical protein